MKPRNMLIAGFIGSMVALGVFANGIFLFVASLSLCGLMHLFGHHGGQGHTHSPTDEKKSETG